MLIKALLVVAIGVLLWENIRLRRLKREHEALVTKNKEAEAKFWKRWRELFPKQGDV